MECALLFPANAGLGGGNGRSSGLRPLLAARPLRGGVWATMLTASGLPEKMSVTMGLATIRRLQLRDSPGFSPGSLLMVAHASLSMRRGHAPGGGAPRQPTNCGCKVSANIGEYKTKTSFFSVRSRKLEVRRKIGDDKNNLVQRGRCTSYSYSYLPFVGGTAPSPYHTQASRNSPTSA